MNAELAARTGDQKLGRRKHTFRPLSGTTPENMGVSEIRGYLRVALRVTIRVL